MPSAFGPALLNDPAVAVGIVEEEERIPAPAASIQPGAAFPVLDAAHVDAALQELCPRRLDVGDHQLQTLA